MTLAEFKAWLEGFESAIGAAPDAEQWAKIKARLDTVVAVTGTPSLPLRRDVWPYDADRVRYNSPQTTWTVPAWAHGQIIC